MRALSIERVVIVVLVVVLAASVCIAACGRSVEDPVRPATSKDSVVQELAAVRSRCAARAARLFVDHPRGARSASG